MEVADFSVFVFEELEMEEMKQALPEQENENTLTHLLRLWGLDSEPFPIAYEGWWDITVRNFEEGR